MGSYQRISTSVAIENKSKKAYLVGGGIASLAAAFYLIQDGHLEGKNITILERCPIAGGSMDGCGNEKDGYIIRGGREMEEHYECTWDLFGQIPSIYEDNKTVLEEFKQLNDRDPNFSTCRVIKSGGEKVDVSSFGLSEGHIKQLLKLLLDTEKTLGATTVEEFFDQSFLETNFWCLWRTMFAFENWHSVVEMKRYMERFIHLLPGMGRMEKLLFSKYNQYESFILPLQKYLEKKEVVFEYNAVVMDMCFDITPDRKSVTAIHLLRQNKEETISICENDLVFITNGSMVENATYGNMNKAPEFNHELGACWRLWKNIAQNSPEFGNPDAFCSDSSKSNWESFTITCTDSKMADILKHYSGRDPYSGKTVTGGIITIKDSSWLLSVTCNRQPHFVNQPSNVLVLWAYGLFSDAIGDFVKKKMCECTGEELATELLFHLGVKENEMPELIKTLNVIPCMMPYTTSHFMPRVLGDRPKVIPNGSKNFAFLGQFAEIPNECVFTVEYSVRSAMMAVYSLLSLNKQVPKIYPSKYDIRVLTNALKALYGNHPFPAQAIITKLLKDTSFEGLI